MRKIDVNPSGSFDIDRNTNAPLCLLEWIANCHTFIPVEITYSDEDNSIVTVRLSVKPSDVIRCINYINANLKALA